MSNHDCNHHEHLYYPLLNGNRSSGSGGDGSGFAAIVSEIACFVITALILMIFGIEVSEVPGVLIFIMSQGIAFGVVILLAKKLR